jgi:hypothetical protein
LKVNPHLVLIQGRYNLYLLLQIKIILIDKKEILILKNITLWDIMTGIVLLAMLGLLIVFAQIFINPQTAFNPLPPPTMIPTVDIPTSTATLRSLPPTWTPEQVKNAQATLEATRSTLRPSQTAPPSATAPLIPIYTFTAETNPTIAKTAAPPLAPTSPPQPTHTTISTGIAAPTQPAEPTSPPRPDNPPAPTNQPAPLSPTNTTPPNPQPTSPNPPGTAAIVWKATHETGDIREWKEHGDFIRQGTSAYYTMVTSPTHSGNYAVALTIDTKGSSNSGSYAAYLFYWDQLPGDAYYYSAWYFIPAGTQPQDWWNVWQWKSTYNGNTDSSVPMHVLDIRQRATGQLSLQLIYRPDLSSKINYQQNIKYVPTDQWFHIEAYYKKGTSNNGQVIVWQDGTEIFNLSGVQTTERDNTVYWSVNHYTDYILPNPSSIYIDDAAISTQRLGPGYVLP